MQRATRHEAETAITETLEECYGNEGDISAMLNRAAAQRRLDEVTKPESG